MYKDMNIYPLPKSAFVAVTLLCNSRCVMCDIWKHKGRDFLPVNVYKKLPSSLEMIDVTGGEPFLRPDLPDIIKVLRQTCPKSRILITTNGFLVKTIKTEILKILTFDPNIAIRVSLDGLGKTHQYVRRIPQAYEKAIESIEYIKNAGVKDVGVIFTLTKINQRELRPVFDYCQRNKLAFSLNVVHDSSVYFGQEKILLRPESEDVKLDLDYIYRKQLKSLNPKNWAKAWFMKHSYQYMLTNKRPIPCGAGENFFYMDPSANIFMCHFKNNIIGNLINSSFDDIWKSGIKTKSLISTKSCHDCWMMCTAKDGIMKNKAAILIENFTSINKLIGLL